jgi:hypothetical protein
MRFLKFLAVMVIIATAFGLGQLWFQTVIIGGYLRSANLFLTVLALVAPVALVVGAVYALIKIIRFDPAKLAMLAVMMVAVSSLTSCSYASANLQTLISDDCGVKWTLVQPGNAVPSRIGPCAYKVSVPDYPMQGETNFKTSFKNRVLATVEIGYEYVITDAIVFIGEAKYLGKANSAADDSTNASTAYESAENAVIDKRIRDVSTGLLINEDIVDFSQAEFEDKLLGQINERLKDKGVKLNFISFVPTPEEQTRLAIDMMTAMKIYESRGLTELGQKVTVARAGATKIDVGTAPQPTSPTQK